MIVSIPDLCLLSYFIICSLITVPTELAPSTVSLTGGRAQGEDSKQKYLLNAKQLY